MKLFAFIILFFAAFNLQAQTERALAREGNNAYKSERYGDAELAYKSSLSANTESDLPETVYNLGNTLFEQERWEEASEQFKRAAKMVKDKKDLAEIYHNLGNSLLQEGKLDESIESYKNALRNNPSDMETKYNLSYAQQLKKEQEQQKQDKQCNNPQQQENQDEQEKKEQEEKEQEQNENQEQQEENKEEQQKQEQEKSEEEKKQEEQEKQQQEKQEGEKGEEEKQEQQQAEEKDSEPQDSTGMAAPQEVELSREEMERLLEALKNEELKVQEKLRQKNGKVSRSDKDW